METSPIVSIRMSDMNAIISARILAAIGNGATVENAMDAVLGAGTYDRVVGELYDELRARAEPVA